MSRRGTTRRSRRLVAARPARHVSVPGLGLADGAIVVGTTRLTDLGALYETVMGEDLAGALITNVHGVGTHISTVGGMQTYAYALFMGPQALDAADVFPATAAGGHNWWLRRVMLHRGQAHNVLAAASEFDEHRLRFDTRRTRRVKPNVADTLWFAEEVVGQTQNASWTFDIRTSE